ncbi:MAG: hypothetical protein Q7R45_03510 [Sulfuricaulis sp.]|nr:hypothetical protein [Sulfuricaulis sp.]
MTRLVSIGTKIKQLEGLLDTKDLSDWENEFLHSISVRTDCGRDTTGLTGKQIERLEELWSKHFA